MTRDDNLNHVVSMRMSGEIYLDGVSPTPSSGSSSHSIHLDPWPWKLVDFTQ